MRKARVLPDPVLAEPRTSRVWSEGGMASVWIGVGLRKCDDFRPVVIASALDEGSNQNSELPFSVRRDRGNCENVSIELVGSYTAHQSLHLTLSIDLRCYEGSQMRRYDLAAPLAHRPLVAVWPDST